MKSMVLFLILTVAIVTMAQPPDTLWTRTFGGDSADFGYSIQQTSDGGFIITGSTASFGIDSSDVWLIKTDSLGNEEWNRTFGGSGNDVGNCVLEDTMDIGYIIVGSTTSFSPDSTNDVCLVKTDLNGDTMWTRTFGGIHNDVGNSIAQTNDGGYIIVGTTYSYGTGFGEVWLIKTTARGDSEWTRTFWGWGPSEGNAVQPTTDGGYIIIGTTPLMSGNHAAWLIKTDSNGDSLWTRTFGVWGVYGRSVRQTTDGGYILAVLLVDQGGAIIKTDSLGNQLWVNDQVGSGSVRQTSDGGYIVIGTSFSGFPWYQYYAHLIKTDLLGNWYWSWTFQSNSSGSDAQQTFDGGYILVGTINTWTSNPDMFLIRLSRDSIPSPVLSATPDTLFFWGWVGGPNYPDQWFQVENLGFNTLNYALSDDVPWLTEDPMNGGPVPPTNTVWVSVDDTGLAEGIHYGHIIVTAPGAQESPDTVFVKLRLFPSNVPSFRGNDIPKEFGLLPPYPNPFNPTTNLTFDVPQARYVDLSIYDIQGRKVAELNSGWCPPGTYHTTFNGLNLSSGIYFCQMVAGDFVQTRKLLLLK